MKTVLLVDDHPSVGAALVRLIERAGWTAHHVRTLQEADAALAQRSYRVALVDRYLAGFVDATKWAQELDKTPTIVAMISSSPSDAWRGLRCQKPLIVEDIRTLLDTIEINYPWVEPPAEE